MNFLLQSMLFGGGICFAVVGAAILPPSISTSATPALNLFPSFLAATLLFLGGTVAGIGLYGLIKDAVGR